MGEDSEKMLRGSVDHHHQGPMKLSRGLKDGQESQTVFTSGSEDLSQKEMGVGYKAFRHRKEKGH